MPMYNFECKPCDINWDVILKLSELKSYPSECPNCKKQCSQRFNAPILNFKGRGFYETDYKNVVKKVKLDPKTGETQTLWEK